MIQIELSGRNYQNYFYKFFLIFCCLILPSLLFGQPNYSLVQKQEYEEWYEKPTFVPDARITGEYHIYSFNDRKSNFSEETNNAIRQDFIIHLKTETSKKVSANISIANQPYHIGDDRGSYYTRNETERKASIDNTGRDQNGDLYLIIDEAFLEYNYHPMVKFRVGKQFINPGDREGLIYRGHVSSITQTCGVGTWCYYIGGAKIGRRDHDSIYWFNLNYPIYESGNYISDLWNPKSAPDKSLNVELYRILNNQFDVALSNYGGAIYRTGGDELNGIDEASPYQVTCTGIDCNDPNGDTYLVYYDAVEEYYGFNLDWRHNNFSFKSRYAQLNGKRFYHTGTRETTSMNEIDERGVYGAVYYFAGEWIFTNQWKWGVEALMSSGTKREDNQYWNYLNSGFYEINKGTYGSSGIYFSGYDGTGEGHSVNNLTYWSTSLSYASLSKKYWFTSNLYHFQRTEPVINDAGEFKLDIGYELDTSFKFELEKNFQVELQVNYFAVGDAYVKNDNDTPKSEQIDDFISVMVAIHYWF